MACQSNAGPKPLNGARVISVVYNNLTLHILQLHYQFTVKIRSFKLISESETWIESKFSFLSDFTCWEEWPLSSFLSLFIFLFVFSIFLSLLKGRPSHFSGVGIVRGIGSQTFGVNVNSSNFDGINSIKSTLFATNSSLLIVRKYLFRTPIFSNLVISFVAFLLEYSNV